jgi:RHS repeat-associated protein
MCCELILGSQLISVGCGSGQQELTSTIYGYTPQGQLNIKRDIASPGGAHDWTGFAYDTMGRMTGISYPSGVSAGYAYSNGKLTTMTATVNGTTQVVAGSINYQASGGISSWTYGNQLQRLRYIDADGRLTAIHTDGIQGLYYSYNANDEVTNIQNGANPNVTQAFAYDAVGRILQTSWPTGGQSFLFDPNGNRTAHAWHPGWPNVAAEPYAIDSASNRVLNTHLNYTYDGRGNRASQSWGGSTATYSYDAFNRMKQVSRNVAIGWMNPNYVTTNYPSGTTHYAVNALGQRVSKSGPLGTSRFMYAGQNTLLTEHTNGQWTSYLWLGGQPVGMVRNNTLHWIHNDHLGRPEMVTNAAQQRVWWATNYAYDRAVNMDWIGGLNLGLPGQYYDAESGHWYNGFRDYDSRLGRYLQSDPIGLAGGINTFEYASGRPSSVTDPLGLADPALELYAAGVIDKMPDRRGPDYIHATVGVYVATGGVTITKNGTLFVGYGVAHGTPKSVVGGKLGFSLSAGHMLGCPKTGGQVDNFLTGATTGGSAYYGLGGGYGKNAAGSAVEVGVGTPGVALQPLEYMIPILNTGAGW